jgi:hypothetical protein
MWKYIEDHFKKMLPIWIVSIVIAGFSVAGAGLLAWKDMAVRDMEIQRDLIQIQCRIGMAELLPEEDRRRCVYIKPFIEDVEDILEGKEEEDGVYEDPS